MKNAILLLNFSLIFLISCIIDEHNNPLDNNGVSNIIDEEPPEITLIGPDTIEIPLKDPMDTLDVWKTSYTVKDNQDPDPYVTVIVEFSVDSVQTKPMEYRATDKSGNTSTVLRYVVIVPDSKKDTTKPKIFVPMIDVQILKGETFPPLKNVTAYDETDLDLTGKILIEGTVNTEKTGEYFLTYTVKDNSGNVATLIRKITVLQVSCCDDDYPALTIIGPKILHLQLTEQYVEPGYLAYDTTDGDITSIVKIINNIKDVPGTYTVTYAVTDKSLSVNTEINWTDK